MVGKIWFNPDRPYTGDGKRTRDIYDKNPDEKIKPEYVDNKGKPIKKK